MTLKKLKNFLKKIIEVLENYSVVAKKESKSRRLNDPTTHGCDDRWKDKSVV
jgi:hypothetical protein